MNIISLIRRYMAKDGSVAFWHTPLKLRNDSWNSGGGFPIDFSPKVAYTGPRDAARIPMLDYKGDIGIQYNPCAVAQEGLGWLQCFIDGDQQGLKRAKANGDWLISWMELREDGSAWLPYLFDIKEFKLVAPFYSGLSQGNAISLLLRLECLTGESGYGDAARALLLPLITPVDQGGLSREIDGVWLIEEFVMDRVSGVLDGWMFAILALVDLKLFDPTPANSQRCARAIESLEAFLPRFDLGYWSRADLYTDKPKMPASNFYHYLHILQLEALAQHEGSAVLKYYAQKWQKNRDSRICRMRALALKVFLKLVRY